MKIMVKWQTIIIFIVIIMQLISQNHCSLCLYIFNKIYIKNKRIKWKTHNNDIKNLINNINLIINYNHVQILPKEVCDEWRSKKHFDICGCFMHLYIR